MCIMVLHLERVYDVRCALCELREEKRNSHSVSVVASNDRLERLCHAGSNSSDTERDVLIEDAIKCILHLPFNAVKSVVDNPKAAAFHSVLKMK
jgi:hypothetical protein